jgi:hypothetical protein
LRIATVMSHLGAETPRDRRRTQLRSCYDLARFGSCQRCVTCLRAILVYVRLVNVRALEVQ